MIEPRPIATVIDYDGLLAAIRTRALELDTSQMTLDAVSGLPPGYIGKLLAPVPLRKIGMTSLGPLLQTLGLALVVVVDEAASARLAHRMTTKRRCQLSPAKLGVVEIRISRRKLGLAGRRGGKARALNLTAKKRSQIARKGGKARVRRARLAAVRARGRHLAGVKSAQVRAARLQAAGIAAPIGQACTPSPERQD